MILLFLQGLQHYALICSFSQRGQPEPADYLLLKQTHYRFFLPHSEITIDHLKI